MFVRLSRRNIRSVVWELPHLRDIHLDHNDIDLCAGRLFVCEIRFPRKKPPLQIHHCNSHCSFNRPGPSSLPDAEQSRDAQHDVGRDSPESRESVRPLLDANLLGIIVSVRINRSCTNRWRGRNSDNLGDRHAVDALGEIVVLSPFVVLRHAYSNLTSCCVMGRFPSPTKAS